ncbi:SPOR domain-containing protein [Xanthobacter sediminis]
MVDESRFRYRRDGSARDEGDVGARAPSAREDARAAQEARPAPSRPLPPGPQAPARSAPPVRDAAPPLPPREAPQRQAPPPRPVQPSRELPTQGAAPARPAPRSAPLPSARPAAARPPAAPAAGGSVDPLAELARLIGEQDPFVDFADLQPEPTAPRAPAPSARAATPGDARTQLDPRALPRQDVRLGRRSGEATAPRAPAETEVTASRTQARPAAPRQTIARVGQDPTQPAPQPRPAAQDPLTSRSAPLPQGRRADAAFGEADYGEGTRRAPPRPAAAPDLPRRQASLAAPPQRAALMPPRGDGEPVDRTATSVRLGYGSLAHQAQVPPTGRQPPEGRPAPEEDYYEAPPRPAPAADARRPQAQPQAQPYPQAQEQSAAYAYSAPRRPEDDYEDYDEAYDPQFGEDGYMPPHGEEVYDGEARRRKGRSALLLVACVLGLIIAGTAGVFAYRMAVHGSATGTGNGPPVIRADTAPSKIVTPPSNAPQDAQQKLIYDRVGGAGSGSEKMLPREEQPVDVTTAAMRTAPPAATDPVINSLSTEPKRVRTLTVRADGSIAPESAPAAAPSPAAPASPSPGVQALAAYAASQMPGAPPTMLNVPAANSGAPAVSRTGDYVVQVASQRSEADAMGSWKALQTRYPNLLGSYMASVKRADLGDRGIYYRAQVGPFASKDQANDLCQALRSQGGDCMVTKN